MESTNEDCRSHGCHGELRRHFEPQVSKDASRSRLDDFHVRKRVIWWWKVTKASALPPVRSRPKLNGTTHRSSAFDTECDLCGLRLSLPRWNVPRNNGWCTLQELGGSFVPTVFVATAGGRESWPENDSRGCPLGFALRRTITDARYRRRRLVRWLGCLPGDCRRRSDRGASRLGH